MLVNNIMTVKSASSVNVSLSFDVLRPYLEDAENLFIIPILGAALYQALETYVLATEPISDPTYDSLLEPTYKAISLYALYLGVDELAVNVSSSGIYEIMSDTHKSAPQYKIMNLKETYLSRAHRQVEAMLGFIDNRYSFFHSFIDSPKSKCFFKNASEFQIQFDIHSSRRVFISLLPIIASIEMKYIKPTLSPALFDSLKSEFQGGTALPADSQALLNLITPALAHLTIARALLEIPVDTLDWGAFNNSVNTFNNMQSKSEVNRERISAMHQANQFDGEAELKMLQEFLDNNASATKYALYFNSSRYAGAANSVKRNEFINESTKSIFVV